MTGDQLDNIEDLVRASVADIILSDEVESMINDGILDAEDDVYIIQEWAALLLLSFHCIVKHVPEHAPLQRQPCGQYLSGTHPKRYTRYMLMVKMLDISNIMITPNFECNSVP